MGMTPNGVMVFIGNRLLPTSEPYGFKDPVRGQMLVENLNILSSDPVGVEL